MEGYESGVGWVAWPLEGVDVCMVVCVVWKGGEICGFETRELVLGDVIFRFLFLGDGGWYGGGENSLMGREG